MGAALAVRVYVQWKHLPDRPFRVLVRMALMALDDDPDPKYFGGRELLIDALGLDPAKGTSGRMATRAVSDLVKAGAIERTKSGGRRMEYTLTLDRKPAPVVPLPVAPPAPAKPSLRVVKARNSNLKSARARLDKA